MYFNHLENFFIGNLGSQGSQSKSPYAGGFSSPLPSPASVGSTASTSSGGGAAYGDSSASASATIPRHIFNKAGEYLSISAHINTCLELWKLSDVYMEQCRGQSLGFDCERIGFLRSLPVSHSLLTAILKSTVSLPISTMNIVQFPFTLPPPHSCLKCL